LGELPRERVRGRFTLSVAYGATSPEGRGYLCVDFLRVADIGGSSHFAFGKMLFTRKASLEADRPTGFCVAAIFLPPHHAIYNYRIYNYKERKFMSKKQSALGKDFFSIFNDNIIGVKEGAATTLRISNIEPRSDQPRKQFDREALEALAESVATFGVLQPILVRQNPVLEGSYEIVAGERRWRAAKMAGLTEVPVIVLDGDDLKTAQIALIENVQRENLNVVEEALAYRELIDRFDMTQDEVARQVGKARTTVTNLLRLLELPEEALTLLKNGDITAGHARALLGLVNKDSVATLAARVAERQLSVRDTELLVRRENMPPVEEIEDITGHAQTRAWMKDLERRTREALGRKVKITQNEKKKSIELFYEDDADMEALLVALCGEGFFEDEE
jgi:ParB family chromosome partitioning protein